MASIAVSTLVVPYFKVVAVTIPANTALPEPSIVAPIPGPKAPPPALKQVPAVIIPEVTSIPVELMVTSLLAGH